MVESYDPDTNKTIRLLTNQLTWSAKTIAAIYKDRWQIEILFKTIKQNLKIKSFLGTSQNAVMTQILICMITSLLLKYIAKEANRNWTVQSLMVIISTLLFIKQDIWIWLNKPKLIDDFSERNTGQLGPVY
nr:transposase [Spirochaeta cellobiosiphila]